MKSRKGTLIVIMLMILFSLTVGLAVNFIWHGSGKTLQPVTKLANDVVQPIHSENSKTDRLLQRKLMPKVSLPSTSFISNRGQVSDESVKYILKDRQASLYFANDGITFCIKGKGDEGGQKQHEGKTEESYHENA